MIATARRKPTRFPWDLELWTAYALRVRTLQISYARFLRSFPPLRGATLIELNSLTRVLDRIDQTMTQIQAAAQRQNPNTIIKLAQPQPVVSPWSQPMTCAQAISVVLPAKTWEVLALGILESRVTSSDLYEDALRTVTESDPLARRIESLVDAIDTARHRLCRLAQKQQPQWTKAPEAFAFRIDPAAIRKRNQHHRAPDGQFR